MCHVAQSCPTFYYSYSSSEKSLGQALLPDSACRRWRSGWRAEKSLLVSASRCSDSRWYYACSLGSLRSDLLKSSTSWLLPCISSLACSRVGASLFAAGCCRITLPRYWAFLSVCSPSRSEAPSTLDALLWEAWSAPIAFVWAATGSHFLFRATSASSITLPLQFHSCLISASVSIPRFAVNWLLIFGQLFRSLEWSSHRGLRRRSLIVSVMVRR